jgi:hypothetical protein
MDAEQLQILKENIKQGIGESSAQTKETHDILAKKNRSCKKQLKKCNEFKDKLIEYHRGILSEYNIQLDNDVPEKELRKLYTYAEGVRVHINLQQDDCNQLNYRIQRKQYVYSMIISAFAVLITTVFSILALLDIKFPIKNPTPCCSIKTEQTQIISGKGSSNVDDQALPLLDSANKSE